MKPIVLAPPEAVAEAAARDQKPRRIARLLCGCGREKAEREDDGACRRRA